MRARPLRLVLALAFGLAACAARADIYTWVDAKGTVNVSNVSPPEGVKLTKVTQDSPPMMLPPPNVAAEAARQAEVQVLAARVNQLEYEAEFSRRQVAAMATYTPPPQVYGPQYMPQYTQQYAPDPPQYANNGCDSSWSQGQCGAGWSPWFFPTVVVVGTPGFRRPSPPFHGGRKFPMQTAARGPVGFSRH
jgi:Domain of unknown function (DUF4124)